MQDFEPIDRAVAYIEGHLTGPLSLQEAARLAGYSPFHFHRLFLAVTGETFAAYVRRRRLSESARVLAESGRRTLDVALEYQYESQEAFTRAFRRQFGVTPGQYRRWGPAANLTGRPPQSFAQGGKVMEPRIVEKDAFAIMGMVYFGENRNGEITQLWTEFNRRFEKVPHRLSEGAYGFCFMDEKTNPNFWYICAAPISRIGEIPMEMVAKTVPAHTYAVFTHRGPIATLHDTYAQAYGTWLPNSGYEPAATFDFEYYDDRFTGVDDPASELDIYIPIKRKS
ncbi:MAG: AraC family transcriptional regulator [Bacillota bacterium]